MDSDIQTEHMLMEIQDELRVMEDKVADREAQIDALIDMNKKRERALLDCLEALVGYVTMMEQNVVQPAIGSLLDELRTHHHAVAQYRDEAVTKINRAVTSSSSRLGKLLSHLHNPSANIVAMEDKRRAAQDWDGPAYQPEDAYILCHSLLQDKEQMQQIIRFCVQCLQTGKDPSEVGSERQSRVIERQNREITMLQQQNDSLKSEVQRLHSLSQQAASQAHDGGRLQAELNILSQEKGILAQQLESLEGTVRQERKILNQKIESLQNSLSQVSAERDASKAKVDLAEREASQATRERHLLQQQNLSLDGAIQQLQQERSLTLRKLEQAETKNLLLEQERAIVRQKFETVDRALSQGESEKMVLADELEALRNKMFNGMVDSSDITLRDALRQERDEAHRLRLELELLQRERASEQSEKGEELAGTKTENLRLRNELERKAAMLEQSSAREHEMATKCKVLTDVADRLKMELEQAILSKPGNSLSAAGMNADGTMHNRITAFEMNMNKLNNEVGNVEGRINSLDLSHERALQQLDRERALFEAERTECDQIVKQMTEELELLVHENQQLKQQQSQQHLHVSPHWNRHGR
eukprot:TRINITY_DN3801_c0_g1_i1.p1 TRINITY_DN3801_c0_g1~~TRINITY_DN3801_c0_g1_i1.p1  ORF type:complete len:589 (+),score=229.10 TRINITY_DN3801_c0_g1_i1:56-1822(+)